jgi:hypothetical protein
MIIIIGLVILVAAVVAGVAGVLSNSGSGHALTHHFAVFGYHVTGSTGTLFLYGIVVGALGLVGLSLLLAGARRTSRRGLMQSRRETAAVTEDRDDLRGQRETARVYTASTLGNSPRTAAGCYTDRRKRRRPARQAAPVRAPILFPAGRRARTSGKRSSRFRYPRW